MRPASTGLIVGARARGVKGEAAPGWNPIGTSLLERMPLNSRARHLVQFRMRPRPISRNSWTDFTQAMAVTWLAGLPLLILVVPEGQPRDPWEPAKEVEAPRSADEDEIHALVLGGLQSHERLVVVTETARDITFDRSLPKGSWGEEVFSDYVAQNETPRPLDLDRFPEIRAFGITPGQERLLFAAGSIEGWKAVEARYPGCEGLVRISRVGFDRQHDVAVVSYSVSRAALDGYGRLARFVRREGRWCRDELGVRIFWVS